MKFAMRIGLLLATIVSSTASASIISYQFTGVVSGLASSLTDDFALGQTLTGSFDVESTGGTMQPGRTIYTASNLTVTIGGGYVITGTNGDMIVADDLAGSLDGITVSFTTLFGSALDGALPGYFDIQLDWFANGPITSQSLPVFAPLNTGEIDRSNINFPKDSERLSYRLTSMVQAPTQVPEPMSMLLMGMGLVALLTIKTSGSRKRTPC